MARPHAKALVAPLPHVADQNVALLGAEIDSILSDASLPSLVLQASDRPIVKGHTERVPSAALDVTSMVTGATLDLTLEGASTVTVQLLDPLWKIEASGVLDLNEDERLGRIDIEIDGLWYSLVKASRGDPTVLTLTFEDLAVTSLRRNTRKLVVSRGTMTRAEFIEKMVNEVGSPVVGFFSPEKAEKQTIAPVKVPSVKPASGQTGFDKGVTFKINKATATTAQMAEVATVLDVADKLQVPYRVRLAMLVAGAGESTFIPTRVSSAGAKGVFQLLSSWWSKIGWQDTTKQAYYFVQHGFYRYGGAAALASANPSMTPGEIASRVEGSATDGQNAGYYNGFLDEAKNIASLWKSGKGTSTPDTVFKVKRYTFTRGLPGRKESSWDAAQRLAAEVNWRFFVAGGVAAFVTDDWLIGQQTASLEITFDSDFLVDRPTYDHDEGKIANTVTLQVSAEHWAVRPGQVVIFNDPVWGPINGRWLVLEAQQNLLDSTDCTVTLTKPVKPRPEPAPEITTAQKAKPGDITKFYVNPFGDGKAIPTRIDEGVDYSWSSPGHIRAIGKAKIESITPVTSGWGPWYMIYRLLEGPWKGRYVFVAEHFEPIQAMAGKTVDKGTVIAHVAAGGSIEMGWGTSTPQHAYAWKVYKEGQRTAAGMDFNDQMVKLGVGSGHRDMRYPAQILGTYP